MACKSKFIISGYHQFSDGTEIVEVPDVFTSREKAAKEVSTIVNETIAECDDGDEPVFPEDCSEGYRYETSSGEILAMKIVEVRG